MNQLSMAAYCAVVKMPVLQQRRSKAVLGKSTPIKKKIKKPQGLFTVILKLHGKIRQVFCNIQPDFPQMLSSPIPMRECDRILTPRT